MKDKIMIFIIGILLGAVIASGAFYLYASNNSNECNQNNMQMNGGQPPEMPNGQNGDNGQPPEMPNGQQPSLPNNN